MVLARVRRGEEIAVTDHGRVIARITPAHSSPLAALINTGRVQPATVRGPAPRPTVPMNEALAAGPLLQQLRAEERY